MAGIYLHIPFCKKACHYCNFHFSTQTNYISNFTKSVLKEIELQKNYLTTPVNTIYIGGGTPSLLPNEDLGQITNQLKAQFVLDPMIEFTIEANPDDITKDKLMYWKDLGINRLSIGIQSFQQSALNWMNRAHSALQSHQAIELAKKMGFENISTDLIYGTPQISKQDVRMDLNLLMDYEIPHISCYALTVEPKTALFKMIENKTMQDIDHQHQAEHFDLVVDFLETKGMEHYEISNFAMPGFRSKHNSNYWKGIPYLGLGPSAHSYNQKTRQWNVSNNSLYFTSMSKNTLPFELENLSLNAQYNEYMMISLRCMEGISYDVLEKKFGASFVVYTKNKAKEVESKIQYNNQGFALNKSAKFFADGIASDFFILD